MYVCLFEREQHVCAIHWHTHTCTHNHTFCCLKHKPIWSDAVFRITLKQKEILNIEAKKLEKSDKKKKKEKNNNQTHSNSWNLNFKSHKFSLIWLGSFEVFSSSKMCISILVFLFPIFNDSLQISVCVCVFFRLGSARQFRL